MSQVKISTGKGDMIVELYDNETPITTNNFKKLISEGFYNGLNFHRVLPNFVILSASERGLPFSSNASLIVLNLIMIKGLLNKPGLC